MERLNPMMFSAWAEVCDGWRLLDRPDLTVNVESLPPTHGFPTPFARRPPQTVYVLRGELEVELDGKRHLLRVGERLSIPAGRPHRMWNHTSDEIRLLVVSTPATRESWDLGASPALELDWDDEDSNPYADTQIRGH